MDSVIHWVTQYGYLGIFFSLMFGIIGVPLPDEGLLAFAGYLVFKGDMHLLPTMAAAFFGTTCGISLSYGLGRTIGVTLATRYGARMHMTPASLSRVQVWFERFGKWVLLAGYFLPGIRHLTAFVAGSSRMPFSLFALFAYLGGFCWSVTFILAGYMLGQEWKKVTMQIRSHLILVSAGVVALLMIFFLLHLVRKRR